MSQVIDIANLTSSKATQPTMELSASLSRRGFHGLGSCMNQSTNLAWCSSLTRCDVDGTFILFLSHPFPSVSAQAACSVYEDPPCSASRAPLLACGCCQTSNIQTWDAHRTSHLHDSMVASTGPKQGHSSLPNLCRNYWWKKGITHCHTNGEKGIALGSQKIQTKS